MGQPSPIVGGHGKSRSLNVADNRAINLMVMLRDTPDGKGKAYLAMTPGLDLITTTGAGPVRASRVVDGVLYVVSGTGFYAVTAAYGVTLLGNLVSTSGPLSIIDNGAFGQIALFDGVNGYLYAASVFSVITLPFSGPVQATYQDDFGLVYEVNTQIWWQSNAGDLSTWAALAFTSSDGSPDNIVALISIHREIWVLKAAHTEVWVNAGNNNFAFSRLDGVFLQQGCVAPWSVAIGGATGENLFWLAANEQGQGRVVMAAGYQAMTISTVDMSTEIATYSKISDAIAYCYEQEGEGFYVITFPTAGETWVYGVRSKLWHRRASFSNGVFGRHWGNCYSFFNGRCVVGDYQSGNLYAFNLDNPLDNGVQRKWLRTWRAMGTAKLVPQRFNYLAIDMETGMQVVTTNPQIMLRWSDDGGHNFSGEQVFQGVGNIGQTAQRVKFNRLGSTKKNAGLDRIFELSSTDAFKVTIMGAEVG